jgi:hypothetical protein
LGDSFHHTTVAPLLITDEDQTVVAIADIIQHHIHNYERWFGAQATQAGPGSQSRLTGFRVTSSATANTFGASIVVFDGTETPAQTGMTYFDFQRIQTINAENANKTYRIRFANSSLGQTSFADAVTAGAYSDICVTLTNNAAQALPFIMFSKRLPSRTKVWAAIASADAVAQWVDFVVGIHEYEA